MGSNPVYATNLKSTIQMANNGRSAWQGHHDFMQKIKQHDETIARLKQEIKNLQENGKA
jgi:hypothetical protein